MPPPLAPDALSPRTPGHPSQRGANAMPLPRSEEEKMLLLWSGRTEPCHFTCW